MTDSGNPQFTTHARSIGENGELQWGGDNEGSEPWSDAIDTGTGVAVTDNGAVQTGGEVPDSGISRWTFDSGDTNSGTVVDVWGSNDGTINGAMTGVSGANQTYTTNEAYSFDGEKDYISQPFNPADGSDHTTSVWIYPTDMSSDHDIAGGYNISPPEDDGDQYRLRLYADGSMDWLTTRRAVKYGIQGATTAISTNNWYHVVATFNSSTGYKLYIDNSQIASSAETTFHPVSSAALDIGRFVYYWQGKMDDFRFYDKTLSRTEVSNLYNTGSIDG